MPTAVFDILGTFFSTEPLRQRLTAIGAPEHTLELWLAESQRDYLALSLAGAYTPLEDVMTAALPRTIAEVGKGSSDPSRHELVIKGLRVLNPADGALDAVARLSRSGWNLVALSDGSEAHAKALLERAGVLPKFSAVISADHARRARPHPDIYSLVKKSTEGEAWLVTSNAADAMGARRVGFRTAWLSKQQKQWLGALKGPDLEVPDLASCVSMLEARGALTHVAVAG